MDEIIKCLFQGLFSFVHVLCEHLCQNLGPLLTSLAEVMFRCVSVGCIPLMEFVCSCWCRSGWYINGGSRSTFDGCFYVFLGLLLSSIIIGTLALGIYALSQYIQDFNPNVAAGVACGILNQPLTGLSFSAVPLTFGRSKGLNIVGDNSVPVTVINRCFNDNRGSAKFYVDGKYAAYTKIDKNVYTCTGSLMYQFQYGRTLRIFSANNSFLASTDILPSVGSVTRFQNANGDEVAVLMPLVTGSGFGIQILRSDSPAAAPLLLLAATAFAQFTSSSYDECNGFVLAGGIFDLILLCILVCFAFYMAIQWRRKRHQLPAKKFYEPNVIEEPPLGVLPFPLGTSSDVACGQHRHHIVANEGVFKPDDRHQKLLSQKHEVDSKYYPTGFLGEDVTNTKEGDIHSLLADSAPSASSGMSSSSQPCFPQGTPSHIDLREALKPVGYTKLKRYLELHNVNVGFSLLKDELVTLAIIYRGQIDFSPLIVEISNCFTQQAR
jgi:hypothetical protein